MIWMNWEHWRERSCKWHNHENESHQQRHILMFPPFPWSPRVHMNSTRNSSTTLARIFGSSGASLSFYSGWKIPKIVDSPPWRHVAGAGPQHQNNASWFPVTLGLRGSSHRVYTDLVGGHGDRWWLTSRTLSHFWMKPVFDIDHYMRADLQCWSFHMPPPWSWGSLGSLGRSWWSTPPSPGWQLGFTPGHLCCTGSPDFHEKWLFLVAPLETLSSYFRGL